MIGHSKNIFFDRAPLIYLVEKNEYFYQTTKEILTELVEKQNKLFTSTVTIAEFGVIPYKANKKQVIEDFEKLLGVTNFNVENITYHVAEIAYKLRAKYTFLTTPDALQLATAIQHNCNKFITNDKKLKKNIGN